MNFALILLISFIGLIYVDGKNPDVLKKKQQEKKHDSTEIADKIIPREILFSKSDVRSVSISPCGRYIAYIGARDGVPNVFVIRSKDVKKIHSATKITHFKKRGVQSYVWAGDSIVYMFDENGDENIKIRRAKISEDKTSKNGFKYEDFPIFNKKSVCAYYQAQVRNGIIIATNNRDRSAFDLYRIDFNDLKNDKVKLKLLYKNNMNAVRYFVDFDCRFILAERITSDGRKEIFLLVKGKSLQKWHAKLIKRFSVEDAASNILNVFGRWVYFLTTENRDKLAISKMCMLCGVERIVFSHNKECVDDVLCVNGRIAGVATYYERQKWFINQKMLRIMAKEIMKYNPEEWSIVSSDKNYSKIICALSYSNKATEYFLYDNKTKKLSFLCSENQKLSEYVLSKTVPVIVKTRDGLNMVCYLTRPISKSKANIQKKYPLIMLIHGGPKARDYLDFSTFVQFLNNRGYAVMTVNYRGSFGFGKDFMNKGNGEWGAKMHEDVLDAVQWAIDNGVTEKDKVAIIGGSYGGYEVLVAVTKSPSVFACGISIVGPSNLATLIESLPPYWLPFQSEIWKMIVGDQIDADLEEISKNKQSGKKNPFKYLLKKYHDVLKEKSPLYHVRNIRVPLMIVHGKHDPRVKKRESDQIVHAIKSLNGKVLYLLFINEGHGIYAQENLLTFFYLVEKFLKHAFCFESNRFQLDIDKKIDKKTAGHSNKDAKILRNTIWK